MGRARRLAVDASAAARRADVLRVPLEATSLGPPSRPRPPWSERPRTRRRRSPRNSTSPNATSLRQAFGEGSTGKGVAKAMRGMAGAVKDLEDRQKSRATRVKRDTLDQALLDLAVFYRDVLMIQLGADVELANGDREPGLRQIASSSTPESTLRRLQAVMRCRERLPLNVAPLLAVEEMALALVEG